MLTPPSRLHCDDHLRPTESAHPSAHQATATWRAGAASPGSMTWRATGGGAYHGAPSPPPHDGPRDGGGSSTGRRRRRLDAHRPLSPGNVSSAVWLRRHAPRRGPCPWQAANPRRKTKMQNQDAKKHTLQGLSLIGPDTRAPWFEFVNIGTL